MEHILMHLKRLGFLVNQLEAIKEGRTEEYGLTLLAELIRARYDASVEEAIVGIAENIALVSSTLRASYEKDPAHFDMCRVFDATDIEAAGLKAVATMVADDVVENTAHGHK